MKNESLSGICCERPAEQRAAEPGDQPPASAKARSFTRAGSTV